MEKINFSFKTLICDRCKEIFTFPPFPEHAKKIQCLVGQKESSKIFLYNFSINTILICMLCHSDLM